MHVRASLGTLLSSLMLAESQVVNIIEVKKSGNVFVADRGLNIWEVHALFDCDVAWGHVGGHTLATTLGDCESGHLVGTSLLPGDDCGCVSKVTHDIN